MKRAKSIYISIALIVGSIWAGSYAAAEMSTPIMKMSEEIKWMDGPASMPPGSKFAILEGDPKKREMVTMRLKFPPKYKIQVHTHPADERVTVISGVLYFGMGEKFDEGKAKKLSEGSFIVMPTNTAMFAWTEEKETVIQLNIMGSWDITYVNPADDPRKK